METDPKFNAILEELKTLHDRKMREYGNESETMGNFARSAQFTKKLINPSIPVNQHPLVMALMYVSKQIDATYDIIGEQKVDTIEALRDKLRDCACYFILAMQLHEESLKKYDGNA